MPVTNQAERRELRESLRAFLEAAYPSLSTESRVGAGDKLDDRVWARLAGEVALTGLLVPEEYDGQGLGVTEAAVALEETARVLLAQPFLTSSVLATLAIRESDDASQAALLLPRLASGDLIATVALDDAGTTVGVERSGTDWLLTGVKEPVLDAAVAQQFVVSARVDGVSCLFLVDADHVEVTLRDGLDLTRGLAEVRFDKSPAVRLGGDATALVDRLGDVAALAAAAELTGIADRSLALAVEYAKTREQFGKLIGSFQAIKHICAEMLATVESSRAATAAAAAAADDDPAGLARTASIAKAWTSTQCVLAAEQLIQVLGGIGYTWEHPAHLLLRRARTLAVLFGDAAMHRERLSELLGLA